MKSVLLGMSGGVDSSVAAALLKQAGYQVIGITMVLIPDNEEDTVMDAQNVANYLGIEHRVLHLENEFREKVIQPFIDSYQNGRTPNPCILCNEHFKFGAMFQYAKENGIDYLATGHYASLKDGLLEKNNSLKDQSYFLYRISPDVLPKLLFPLAEFHSKDEIRLKAHELKLPVASKKDSEEICFVPNKDYVAFLQKNKTKDILEGDFVDKNGKVLGRHKGIIYYTVGQRKGLGISNPTPLYVLEICPPKNQIVLGSEEDLYRSKLKAKDCKFFVDIFPFTRTDVVAKIRFRSPDVKVLNITQIGSSEIEVTLAEPVRAIAAGQSVVFYDQRGHLLGGGIIS